MTHVYEYGPLVVVRFGSVLIAVDSSCRIALVTLMWESLQQRANVARAKAAA